MITIYDLEEIGFKNTGRYQEMKINTVLTAVNDNPKYTRFVPIFIQQWQRRHPDFKIRIVFVGDKIPDYLKEYSQYLILFPNIPKVSSVYVSQMVRLVYPALLDPSDITIITDMDMIPGANQSYYIKKIEDIPDQSFVSLRPGGWAICYNVASTQTWAAMFDVHTLADVRDFLTKHYKFADGIHGGVGWDQDQLLLSQHIQSYSGNVRILDDSFFKRIEPLHLKYDIPQIIEHLKNDDYSDCHFFADMCPWKYNDMRYTILELFKRSL